jgi:DNA-binding Lrp family transcriptional regulator
MVALKLVCAGPARSFADLGASVGISASEAHAAVRRLEEARLWDAGLNRLNRRALLEFLVHGLSYVFPATLNEMTRGMPTGWAAPVFGGKIVANEPPPVWPDPDGEARGQAVKPLYPSVVHAARQDSQLYELLALVDALRLGRARERKIAEQELEKRLMMEKPDA